MRQIIYVKYNRTRSEKFQLKTAIVRENGALSVEKTALTEAGAGHMGSFLGKVPDDPGTESQDPFPGAGV